MVFDDTGLAPADSPDRIFPNTVQVPTGGPLDSKSINSTLSRLQSDVITIQEQSTDVLNKFENLRTVLGQAAAWSRAAARSLEEARVRAQVDAQIKQLASPSADLATFILDFRLLGNVSHQLESTATPGTFLTYPLSRRVRVDPRMGHAKLPYIDLASAFHTSSGRGTTKPLSLVADAKVTEITSENALEITQTDPRFSYNSEPNQLWVLRAAYDLASAVTEVVFDMTIQVPQQFIKEANVLRLIPAPEGQVDIVNILYSADTAVPDTDLTGATFPLNEAAAKTFYFDPVSVASITVRIRSRRWVEEGHHKVFYLGIEDLDLQLVEYDNTFSDSVYGEAKNNGLFTSFKLPKIAGILDSAIVFEKLVGLRTSDGLSTSDTPTETNNGIHIMVFTDADLTNPVWDSVGSIATGTTITPAAPIDLSAFNVDEIFIAVELDKLTTGQTPVLEELHIDYKVKV